MIQPKLNSIYSTQFDVDQTGPSDQSDFCKWLTVDIEAHDEERIYEASFTVGVCSTLWFSRASVDARGKWGHGYLVVPVWDLAAIRHALEVLCELSAANEWQAVVQALSRYMKSDEIDFAPES